MLGRSIDIPFDRDAGTRLLPWIIAVMVYLAALALAAAMLVTGLVADPGGKSLDDVANVAWFVSLGVVALIAAATVLVVVLAVRMSLRVHAAVIRLLHLMGAQDGYVARQFAREALGFGLRGGLIGAVAGAVTILLLGLLLRAAGLLAVPPWILGPWQWAAIAALPFATALIARVSSRQTVLRTLQDLP